MIPGIVLVKGVQQIIDETQERKLLVVLTDGRYHPFIAVTTTANQVPGRGIQAGCQVKDKIPSFYLPLHSTYLREATWIQLDRFVDLDTLKLSLHYRNSNLVKVCRLPQKILMDLLVCSISCKDITGLQEQELWKTLNNIETYYRQGD